MPVQVSLMLYRITSCGCGWALSQLQFINYIITDHRSVSLHEVTNVERLFQLNSRIASVQWMMTSLFQTGTWHGWLNEVKKPYIFDESPCSTICLAVGWFSNSRPSRIIWTKSYLYCHIVYIGIKTDRSAPLTYVFIVAKGSVLFMNWSCITAILFAMRCLSERSVFKISKAALKCLEVGLLWGEQLLIVTEREREREAHVSEKRTLIIHLLPWLWSSDVARSHFTHRA